MMNLFNIASQYCDMILGLTKFIGPDGISDFKIYLDKYDTVSPVYMCGGMPHPVHFREGMQIRNFMRSCDFCNGWTDHEFDDNWQNAILIVIGRTDLVPVLDIEEE